MLFPTFLEGDKGCLSEERLKPRWEIENKNGKDRNQTAIKHRHSIGFYLTYDRHAGNLIPGTYILNMGSELHSQGSQKPRKHLRHFLVAFWGDPLLTCGLTLLHGTVIPAPVPKVVRCQGQTITGTNDFTCLSLIRKLVPLQPQSLRIQFLEYFAVTTTVTAIQLEFPGMTNGSSNGHVNRHTRLVFHQEIRKNEVQKRQKFPRKNSAAAIQIRHSGPRVKNERVVNLAAMVWTAGVERIVATMPPQPRLVRRFNFSALPLPLLHDLEWFCRWWKVGSILVVMGTNTL